MYRCVPLTSLFPCVCSSLYRQLHLPLPLLNAICVLPCLVLCAFLCLCNYLSPTLSVDCCLCFTLYVSISASLRPILPLHWCMCICASHYLCIAIFLYYSLLFHCLSFSVHLPLSMCAYHCLSLSALYIALCLPLPFFFCSCVCVSIESLFLCMCVLVSNSFFFYLSALCLSDTLKMRLKLLLDLTNFEKVFFFFKFCVFFNIFYFELKSAFSCCYIYEI